MKQFDITVKFNDITDRYTLWTAKKPTKTKVIIDFADKHNLKAADIVREAKVIIM